MTGWNSMSTTMLGRDLEGFLELSYSDEVEKENAYGAGSMPVGRGSGNYKAKASLTLYVEEVRALTLALGPGARITDIAPFDIAVQYEYGNLIYKDRIRNCEFASNGIEVKQGDKTISVKFDLIVSHIDWNVV